VDWATLAHDTVHRHAVENTVMEFWVPKKGVKFLPGVSRRTLLHAVGCFIRCGKRSMIASESFSS